MDISFVTRKFQRSIAGLGLATILAASVFTGSALGMTFDDVSSDNYAYDSVDWVSDEGIMTGYEGTNTFGRADTLQRQQAAKILIEAFNLPMDSSDTVTCTGAMDPWAEPYMATANTLGIIEGEGSTGECNAYGDVTRDAFAKMVVVAGGFADTGVLGSDVFMDVEVGGWADMYIGQAWSNSVINGMTATTYSPSSEVIRADAAVMVDRAVNSAEVRYPETSGDDDDDDTTGTGGALEVILSNDSPEDYTYFVQGTNAEVASFEVTASDEDVLVTSFSVELASGDADSITALALYNEEGTRVSRVDSSIDSDDMASMTMLEGGYVVAAGTSEMFRLMNSFSSTAETSTLYSYAFDSSMIESDASSVEVENDLSTGIFGLLVEDTGALLIDDDGTVSNPQVGETEAVIAAFEVTEDSSQKDVTLWSLTLENTGTANLDDAVTDLALYMDGDLVAEGTQIGDYISFQMDEADAPLIQEGTNESFEVRAKITGESARTMIFAIEESLDVMATDEDDNNVSVDVSAYAGSSVTIEAGNVSVVGYDAASDKFRADRQDVELGRFEVTAGTDGLELLTLNVDFDLTETDADVETWFVSDFFENFKVEVNGTSYSMDINGAEGAGEEYTVDLDKALEAGEVYEFVVMADTFTEAEADANNAGDIDDYTNFTIDMSLEGLGGGVTTDGLVMEETADGTAVTDVTPSTVNFRELDGETAGVSINVLSLSSAKSVVVGTQDVLALEFEVEEESEISDLVFSQVAVEEKSGTGSFNNGDVSQVSLYQVESDGTETLLDTVSGSQLASDTADFDNFEVTVAAGTAETFRVYVDFVDDDANAGLTYLAAITTYDVEDDDNNQVYDALDDSADGDFNADADQPTSARTVTLVASGKLYVEMNNEDDTYGTANKRWLQMGETDQGVLALSLRAENEDVTINEWTVYLSAGDVGTTFSKFYVYNEDGVLLGYKSTSSSDDGSITFNATATELTAYADETTTYYVTADLNEYGRDRVGALDGNGLAARTWTATVVEATGDSSNTSLDVDGDDDTSVEAGEVAYGSTTTGARAADGVDATVPEVTAASEAFGYLATELTTVELVSTATYNSQTATLASDLSTGTTRVAIVAITNNSTENIESDANGGVDLRTQLESLAFQINKNLDLTASTFTIDRVGGVDSPVSGTTVLTSDGSTAQAITALITNTAQVEFLNLDSGWTTDDEIAPGETAYYVVECNITALGAGDSDDFIELSMEDLTDTNGAQNGSDGDVHWYDATGAVVKTAVYMGSATDLDAVKVSEQN